MLASPFTSPAVIRYGEEKSWLIISKIEGMSVFKSEVVVW
jgi:hypothetical protein